MTDALQAMTDLSEAPAGAVYRIELNHDPQHPKTPWDWRVVRLSPHTVVSSGWFAETRAHALELAQAAIARQHEQQEPATYYADEEGGLLATSPDLLP